MKVVLPGQTGTLVVLWIAVSLPITLTFGVCEEAILVESTVAIPINVVLTMKLVIKVFVTWIVCRAGFDC